MVDSRLAVQLVEVSGSSSHPFVVINGAIEMSFEGSHVFEPQGLNASSLRKGGSVSRERSTAEPEN
jgi:hypothetical protein